MGVQNFGTNYMFTEKIIQNIKISNIISAFTNYNDSVLKFLDSVRFLW